MDSRFHGNDKPRRMSFPRKWESREGYLAYYPIIYLTFIMRGLLTPISLMPALTHRQIMCQFFGYVNSLGLNMVCFDTVSIVICVSSQANTRLEN